VQSAFVPSEELYTDGEAAYSTGCLSILLWPPFSAALFGLVLFLALTQIKFHAPEFQSQLSVGELASFFTPQVQRWQTDIVAWSEAQGLDPNLAATVMQIESCGNPFAVSPAGATGLFQVMPYHFAEGENSFDPHTNAGRGLSYLKQSLEKFGADPGMALAAYNGGIHGAGRPQELWAQETIDYKYWGEHIYADAFAGKAQSQALQEWLAAGGASLCAQAELRAAGSP
jgi:hypothetical protein